MFKALKNKATQHLLVVNALLYTSVMVSFAFLMPTLIQNGWGLEKIGLATNIIGPLFGIIAALLCGQLIRSKGITTGLAIVVALQLIVSICSINFLASSEFWRFYYLYSPAYIVWCHCLLCLYFINEHL